MVTEMMLDDIKEYPVVIKAAEGAGGKMLLQRITRELKKP